MVLATWTNQQIFSQLDSDLKWTGSTITYSFPTTASALMTAGGEGGGYSSLSATAQAKATLALQLWDDLIASDMVKVNPGTSYTSSNIEFGMTTTGVSYASTYYPSAGSVWFNSNNSSGGNSLVAPEIGRHGFMAYVHEIGHAMGLDHMGAYNGSTSTPSCYQDSTVYSIMSYYGPNWNKGSGQVAWGDWVAGDGVLYSPQTPMLNDVMAIQQIYGIETSTRTGNTVYGFNCNVTDGTQAVYSFSSNRHPVLCIFDSAGIDTLDLSGWSTSSVINLAPGSFSSCDNMTNNISIAYSCSIENAVGGAGADQITGNAIANSLTGNGGNDILSGLDGNDIIRPGAGNDTVDGGAGSDFVYFNAAWSALSYVYSVASNSITFTSSTDGADIVKNVEYFVDALGVQKSFYDLSHTSAPVAAPSVAIAANAVSVVEGNSGAAVYSFTLSLSAASNQVQYVSWSVDLSASQANASDFWGAISGTAQISAGATKGTFTVNVLGDLTVEANESFKVSLTGITGGATTGSGGATGVIVNDDVASLYLTGTSSADILTGASGNDQLVGLGKGDTLVGSGGNDLVVGGNGLDMLTGGSGADVFDYNTVTEARIGTRNASDVVMDFVAGTDKFDLSDIDASLDLSGNQGFVWLGAANIGTLSSGELVFEQFDKAGTANDYTMVYGDVDSDSAIEFAIKCVGLINFTAADFIL